MTRDFVFYQLFEAESSTYTYLIADQLTKDAAIIDPVLETAERDLKLIEEAGLNLKYILDTHVHADHITGAARIREATGAQTAISQYAGVVCADIFLKDNDELYLGKHRVIVLETPGHTDSCLSFSFQDMVFTGDALLIRGCGRTDFQQGSAERLYTSIRTKIFSLPQQTIIYPAHDYRGQTSSTVELEKKWNPRLGLQRSKDDFIKIMAELKFSEPKKIVEALKANMACGRLEQI